MGSSWNPNQRGLVALMFDPRLVPLDFWMDKRVCKGLYL